MKQIIRDLQFHGTINNPNAGRVHPLLRADLHTVPVVVEKSFVQQVEEMVQRHAELNAKHDALLAKWAKEDRLRVLENAHIPVVYGSVQS